MSDLLVYRPRRSSSTRADIPPSIPGVRRHLGATQCCDRCIKGEEHPAPDPGPVIPAPWEEQPPPPASVRDAAVSVLWRVAVMGGLLMAFGPGELIVVGGLVVLACAAGIFVAMEAKP